MKTAAGTSNSDIVREDVKNKDTCETVAIYVVQEMLNIQMDTILAFFNQVVSNLSSKVDEIMCDVQDLKTSLNYISTDHEEKINNIAGNITHVKKEIHNINLLNLEDRKDIKQSKGKVIDLEDRSRRNNLRIDGLRESEREYWEVTEQKV